MNDRLAIEAMLNRINAEYETDVTATFVKLEIDGDRTEYVGFEFDPTGELVEIGLFRKEPVS